MSAEMTMNALKPVVWLALAGCAACASTTMSNADAAVASERHFLRGAQCLDPAMARSWMDLDRDTLLVDAGRNKYRIEVSGACSAVDWSPVLVFRGDPITGRVCGNLGDAILTRDYPCSIRGMQLLDKEQYKALIKQHGLDRKARRKPVETG
jgi:Family of unknown function (DUF6491)